MRLLSIGRRGQFWLIGGLAGAVLLFALGWFFFISPQHGQTANLRNQTASAEQQLQTLRKRLADLKAQSGKLPEYQANLARDQQALPTDPALSDFLRELQAAGDATGVSVSDVTAGTVADATAAPGQASVIPISLTAAGTFAGINRFLDQLQKVQPRAVLIGGADLSPVDADGTIAGRLSLSLSLNVFVAKAGATTPSPKPTG